MRVGVVSQQEGRKLFALALERGLVLAQPLDQAEQRVDKVFISCLAAPPSLPTAFWH